MGLNTVSAGGEGAGGEGGSYRKRLRKLTEPEPVDQFGQRVYGESQFAGGLDPNARRFYPNIGEVGGGYFRSNDEVAQRLGYGPDAGVWLAAGRGIIGKRTLADMNSYRAQEGLNQGGTGTNPLIDKLRALAEMFRQGGGGA